MLDINSMQNYDREQINLTIKRLQTSKHPHLTSKLVMIVIFSLVLTQINDFKTPEIELKYIRLDRSTQK